VAFAFVEAGWPSDHRMMNELCAGLANATLSRRAVMALQSSDGGATLAVKLPESSLWYVAGGPLHRAGGLP